jgi:predicted SAM-dependent methyltransferase
MKGAIGKQAGRVLARSVRLKRRIMLKIRPDKRASLAKHYLRGQGIEIGALHLPLPLPRGARATYVDRLGVSELRKQYPELCEYSIQVDVIDDGESLSRFSSESQDFVVASHFLEHCKNPIGTLETFFRVLKPGGILYLVVPDKRFTFDVDRPITKLEHILRDYNKRSAVSQREHYIEWARFVEKTSNETIEKRVRALMSDDYSIHFHAWTYFELLELMLHLRRELKFAFQIEEFAFAGNESIFILRKTGYKTDLGRHA